LVRRDFGGLMRASAISLGLAITTAGYLQGIAAQLLRDRSQVAPALPIGYEEQREVPA
jgi:hypothetical protein